MPAKKNTEKKKTVILTVPEDSIYAKWINSQNKVAPSLRALIEIAIEYAGVDKDFQTFMNSLALKQIKTENTLNLSSSANKDTQTNSTIIQETKIPASEEHLPKQSKISTKSKEESDSIVETSKEKDSSNKVETVKEESKANDTNKPFALPKYGQNESQNYQPWEDKGLT